MWRFRAVTDLLLIIVGICLACNYRNALPKDPTEESTATINLSAVTNSSQTQVFHEVKQASRLPSAVLDKLGGIADPGQPFNATCAVDPILPMRQLFVAAVSENYCVVSYWQGGIILSMETRIFELSPGRVKRIWVSAGGGLNFRDLKETVELGRMPFQRVPVTPDFRQ
jgi:hypothetical protein